MNDMSALIARLEKATEGSRELDEAIATVAGWCLHRNTRFSGAQSDTGFDCQDCGADSWGSRSKNGFNQRLYDPVPRHTTSLDAALPRENIVYVEFRRGVEPPYWLAIHQDPDGHRVEGEHLTSEAIARRIAALKARSAS